MDSLVIPLSSDVVDMCEGVVGLSVTGDKVVDWILVAMLDCVVKVEF